MGRSGSNKGSYTKWIGGLSSDRSKPASPKRKRSNSGGSSSGGAKYKKSKVKGVVEQAAFSIVAPFQNNGKKSFQHLANNHSDDGGGGSSSKTTRKKQQPNRVTPNHHKKSKAKKAPPTSPTNNQKWSLKHFLPKQRKRSTSVASTRMDSDIRLPRKHTSKEAANVPWMKHLPEQQQSTAAAAAEEGEEEIATTTTSHCSGQKQRMRLPTDNVDPLWLEHLDAELEALADYVRLTPAEQDARHSLIQELTQITQGIGQFARPPAEQAVEYATFGSFAAPAVCTFGSDIDLALWGVIPGVTAEAPPSPAEPPKKKAKTLAKKPPPPPSEVPDKVQEKRRREQSWLDALAAVDDEKTKDDLPTGSQEPPMPSIDDATKNDLPGSKPMASDEDKKPTGSKEPPMPSNDDATKNESGSKPMASDEDKKLAAVAKAMGDVLAALQKKDAVVDETPEDVEKLATSKDGRKEDEPVDEAAKEDGERKEASVDDTKEGENSIDNTEPPLFVLDRKGSSCVDASAGEKQDEKPTKSREDTKDKVEAVADDVNDNDDENSDSDDDSADKLENLNREEREDHFVSPSSSDSDEDEIVKRLYEYAAEDESDEDEMEAEDDADGDESFINNLEVGGLGNDDWSQDGEQLPSNNWAARGDALAALSKLHRQLKKNAWFASSLQFVRNARVPIVKFKSKQLGVDVDISVGGLNGADTSLYAATQAKRYASFAPVVLVLKILMNQQKLDIPFEGGLGSFKLYVLVAFHIHQHVHQLGGKDRPGEVLMSFLFRYGGGAATALAGEVSDQARTDLLQHTTVGCRDMPHCVADMTYVSKVHECTHLFGAVWKRLWERVRNDGSSADKAPFSLLSEMIHVKRLTRGRQQSVQSAEAAVAPEPVDKAVVSYENPYRTAAVENAVVVKPKSAPRFKKNMPPKRTGKRAAKNKRKRSC